MNHPELDQMEDSRPMPLRRESDHRGRRKLFRFVPDISMGTILQIGALVVTVSAAYATYREDRTQMKADIELVKVTADRDRADVKAAVTDFRQDLKELKTDVKDLGQNLAVVKGQTSNTTSRGR